MKRKNPFSQMYEKLNSGGTDKTYMPLMLDIEPTNACNFKCLFCPSGMSFMRRKTGFMDINLFRNIIEEAAIYNMAIRFSRWGEPTLHPQFFDFLKIVKEHGLLCHFNTNGSLLDAKKLQLIIDLKIDSIKFSFQGTDEKTYTEMRHGQSYNSLVQTIKTLFEMRGGTEAPPICTLRQLLPTKLPKW